MYKLNQKAASLKPYEPLKGNFTVRLDANESYKPLDKNIVDEIAEEIKKIEFNRYPDPLAENACTAFAGYYGINKDYVTAGNGSDELISVIINGFFGKGDKVLITSPDFSMYGIYCRIAETDALVYGKDNNFDITPAEIVEKAKGFGAKGLIFSNPCNPTSRALNNEEVKYIINSLPQTLIVLDEAYMDFYGEGLIVEAQKYNNLIVLKTCSKAFGLAAIRLGFAVANKVLTNALRALKSPYNVNSLTAAAGAVVLRHKDYLKKCAAEITAQREKLFAALSGIKGVKVYNSCTNFVFIYTSKSKQIFESLISKGIAVRLQGECLRVNAGNDGENVMFIKAFKEAL